MLTNARVVSPRFGLTIAAFLLGAATLSSDAEAASKSGCTVTSVQYDNDARLAITCSGDANYYYAHSYAVETTCPVKAKDTVKMWASMFQSALLSGRPIDFQYTTTQTGCSIRTLDWGISLR